MLFHPCVTDTSRARTQLSRVPESPASSDDSFLAILAQRLLNCVSVTGVSQWTHRLDGSRSSGDPVHLRCSGFVWDRTLVSPSNEVHNHQPQGKTSGIRPFQEPECEGCCRQGARCQVGDCNGRHGRHRGSRGRDGAGCPASWKQSRGFPSTFR